MAGSVTGNLGSENITLRNMATEDTLSEILDVLRKQGTPNNPGDKPRKDNNKTIEDNTRALKEGSAAWGKFFDKLTEGPVKIIRNLDTEINNASYTFSTLARENGLFGKTLQYAATSVAQMQEQFNAYSKMMQVGGVIASDFESLRVNASELGTDLTGLTRITDQYAQSLKIGSSTTALGLKKLRDTFKAVTDDTELLSDFGRLGVLPQQISEQLLLAAEAQGGFGQVMQRYGGDAKLFGQSMLKSTQDLNIFATAVGANSQLMQTEAAKAAKRASDRYFVDKKLNDGERMAYQYLQNLTGSADVALQVMRSMKGGVTTQEAGIFQAMKGFTGMGNEVDKFVELVANKTEPLEALNQSGLMSFAKNISKDRLDEIESNISAIRSANPQLAELLDNQLNLILSLRDAKPEEIKKHVEGLKSSLDPKKLGTTDTFVSLQDQQVRLAQATAGLNTQFNRLGLLLAASTMTGVNRGVYELGRAGDAMKKYAKEISGLDVPDDVAKAGVDAIADWLNKELPKLKAPTTTETQTTAPSGRVPTGTASMGGITPAGQMDVKMPGGQSRLFNLKDIITNKELQSSTEAFKGKNTQIGTLITGALLQQKIPALGTITAGSDADPSHSATGKHPKGLALDFRVEDIKGRDPETVYRETIAAMEEVLVKDLGLKKGDYYIENERTKGTGPHIHFQFQSQAVADKVREYYQSQIKAAEDSAKPSAKKAEANENTETKTQTSAAPLTGTVNNNMTVATTKPEWVDEAMQQNQNALRTMTAELGSKFDNMYDMLKRKIG